VNGYPKSKHDLTYRDASGKTKRFGEEGLLSWMVTNSPLVTADAVFFTTGDGQIFCLDRFTGRQRWTRETRTDPFPGNHPVNSFWSSPILVEGKLIVAGGALEQATASMSAEYPCCSGRGFVAALDPGTGSLIWKYDLGQLPEKLETPRDVSRGKFKVMYTHGPPTSTVWSTPSYDATTRTLYFGTDTNNSPRRATEDDAREYTKYSCAIVAINVDNGTEQWVSQLVKNDVWHGGDPTWDPVTGQYKDVSIGDTPKVYDIQWEGRPRKVLGVGCKNGGYYVLDRVTGEILHHTTLYTGPPEPERIAEKSEGILALPSALGGLQTGCAFDGARAYTNGIDSLGTVKGSLDGEFLRYPPAGGRVSAIRPSALAEFWRHERPQLTLFHRAQPGRKIVSGDPVGSGIAVANGVAFFTTTMSTKLVGVDAETGQILLEKDLEPVWCGPAISRGRVVVGVGSILWQIDPQLMPEPTAFEMPIETRGAVYSFGLPGKDELDRMPDIEQPGSEG